ncbi:uncharacterized protein LOC132176428 [Corylus avellana]|uniref:uncharacterized protein LOC132176428 n=1 Tax=Corylus avellana TaxID=13451 RepID=UPI00286B4029|nr:uncharacterized protein LOC132176428 [Corylus avellana]
MWVDLTLEANFNNQDINNKWFRTSHPFHQCSSHQLKSAFSHSGEGITSSDLQGSTSPKIPSSVSRSRGKEYRSKKWKAENHDFASSMKHPIKVLSGKSYLVDPQCGEKIKPKSGFINLKGTSMSKSRSVCESSLTGNSIPSCSKPVSTCGDPASRLSSMGNKTCESNTSTITSQSSQQQEQSYTEVSTIPLLSDMRISLRKSCSTRQAPRVEMNNDKRLSRGRKSSSGISSVGSSSNPCYDARSSTSTSLSQRGITPDSRNVMRMTYAAKNKVKNLSVYRASTIKIEEVSCNSRRGTKINLVKSVHQEAAKPRALVPLGVNEQESSFTAAVKSKEKMRAGRFKRLAGDGKENATGRMSVSQKCSGKGIAAVAMIKDQKGTKQSVRHKGGAGLVGSQGKVTVRCEENNKPAKVTQRGTKRIVNPRRPSFDERRAWQHTGLCTVQT